jgi:hypothetical protein
MDIQEVIDAFYWKNGPCCAGCDWWRYFNSMVGECLRSAPVSGAERWAMVGLSRPSFIGSAGHVVTKREHHCGEFKDNFDWSNLPVAYRCRIGAEPKGTEHGS